MVGRRCCQLAAQATNRGTLPRPPRGSTPTWRIAGTTGRMTNGERCWMAQRGLAIWVSPIKDIMRTNRRWWNYEWCTNIHIDHTYHIHCIRGHCSKIRAASLTPNTPDLRKAKSMREPGLCIPCWCMCQFAGIFDGVSHVFHIDIYYKSPNDQHL